MIVYNIMRGNPAALVKAVKPNGNQIVKALGENLVNMSFTLPVFVDFKLHDFIVLDGEKYIINEPVQWEKLEKRRFAYTIQFQHEFYNLKKVQLKAVDPLNNYTKTKFDIMANAATIVDLVVQTVNATYPGWSVGVVDETDYELFSFDGTNCLKALYQLVEKYKTEVWFDNKTIHLQKRLNSSGLSFAYGKGNGLLNINRQNKSDAEIKTRLYVTGSSLNLPVGYRDNIGSLILPNGLNYYQDDAKVALYGLIEDTVTFDIKPEREGTVSAVVAGDGNWKYFTDAALDFDVNAQLVPGLEAKITFNTGQLAGYSFTISNYNHATKTFTINKNEEEKDLDLPSNLLRPAVGDKYVIVNIEMPQTFVDAAEARLQASVEAAYETISDPKFLVAYSARVDKLYVKQNAVSLQLGNTYEFPDTELGINVELRIAGYTRDLQNRDYYPEVEWADSLTPNEVARLEQQQERTLRAIESSGLLDPNSVRKNIFLNRLSERDGYLMLSGTKVKAGFADYAVNAGHATLADLATYALDSDQWDGHQFADYLNQAVKTNSDVRVRSLSSTEYVSGAFGSGFKIDENGDATFDNLTVRKQFNVYELVLNKISGTNGALAVTDTIKIDTVTETPTGYDCTIDTAENTIAVPFQVNDLLRCQVWNGTSIKYYFAKVTATDNGGFTLDKATKVGGGIPAAGDIVVRFGNTTNANRQGLLYLTASDTNAPYLDVLDGVTSDNLAGKTKVRLGKLNGITDADLGALSGYGLYAGNAYIKGAIQVTGGNAETVTGSQSKANTAQSTAISTAASDATTKAAAAQSAAQTYAAAQAALEREVAKAHADGIVDVEEARAIADAVAKLNEAKADATTKANAAQAAAIASASSDATTKSNAAQAAAVLAAASDAQAKVNAVQVGGRNLLSNSSIEKTNGSNYVAYASIQSILLANLGKTITISFDIKTSENDTVYVYSQNGGELTFGAFYVNATTSYQRFSYTAVPYVAGGQVGSNSQLEFYTGHYGNKFITVKNVKIEIGNKATDWTPSPEDVAAGISAADTKAQNAQNAHNTLIANLRNLAYEDVVELSKLGSTVIQGGKVKTTLLDADWIQSNVVTAAYINALQIDASAIKTGTIDAARLNAAQIVVNGGGATTSQAQGYANTAQSNAISTAASDATSKANSAQAAAISAAATDATNKVNALQVGGRNLLQNSGLVKGGGVYLAYAVINSILADNLGQTLTISFDLKTDVAGQVLVYCDNGGFLKFPGGFVAGTTAYQRFAFTGAPYVGSGSGSGSALEFYTAYGGNAPVYVKNVKIERGHKATDWTPAVEDYKALAFEDVVEVAKLGSTVIDGGYLKTSLLDANYIKSSIINASYITALNIVATSIAATTGSIAGFTIESGRIVGDPGGSGSMGSSYGFLEIVSGANPSITVKNKFISSPSGVVLTTFGATLHGFGVDVGTLQVFREVYLTGIANTGSTSGLQPLYINPTSGQVFRIG